MQCACHISRALCFIREALAKREFLRSSTGHRRTSSVTSLGHWVAFCARSIRLKHCFKDDHWQVKHKHGKILRVTTTIGLRRRSPNKLLHIWNVFVSYPTTLRWFVVRSLGVLRSTKFEFSSHGGCLVTRHESGFDAVDGSSTGTRVPRSGWLPEVCSFAPRDPGCRSRSLQGCNAGFGKP